MSFSCLRCGCEGEVNSDTCSITSTKCECVSCKESLTGQNCVYTNIGNCRMCKKSYTLQKVNDKYVFMCDPCCKQLDVKKSSKSNLIRAVSNGDVDLTWELLLNGSNPFYTDAYGNSAMSVIETLTKSLSQLSVAMQENMHEILDMLPKVAHNSINEEILPLMCRTVSEQPPSSANREQLNQKSFCEGENLTDLPPPPALRSISVDAGRHNRSLRFKLTQSRPSRRLKSRRQGFMPSVLERGQQVFTPITLDKIGSDSKGSCSNVEQDRKFSTEAVQQWTFTELSNMIVQPIEVQSCVPNSTLRSPPRSCVFTPPRRGEPSANTSGNVLVVPTKQCSACMDSLPHEEVAYSCSHLGCAGCLCRDCLSRSVFITISSALYAVPVIRCPGCLRRIPTVLWREALESTHVTELGADAVTMLEVESADISGGAGNRILQLNERLYDSFESFIDVAWPSRDGSEYDHEEDEDSLLSQSSSRENSCVKEDLEKEVKAGGESIIDDDLLQLNNVKATDNTTGWSTKAPRKDMVDALHRCFDDMQSMYSLQLQLLDINPAVSNGRDALSQTMELEDNFKLKSAQLSPDDSDVLKYFESYCHPEVAMGPLAYIYSSKPSIELFDVPDLPNSPSPSNFVEFAQFVFPKAFIGKCDLESHIEKMEGTLDSMLDIVEGTRDRAVRDDKQASYDMTIRCFVQFLGDLALVLRSGGLLELVSEFESPVGHIKPREESDLEDELSEEDDWGSSVEERGYGHADDDTPSSSPKISQKSSKYDFEIDVAKEEEMMDTPKRFLLQETDGSSAGSALMRKYLFNAKALLMLRCAGCDETNSLFVTTNGKKKHASYITVHADNRRKLLSHLMKGLDDTAAIQFLKTWNAFYIGGPPRPYITLLINTFLQEFEKRCPDAISDVRSDLSSGVCRGGALKYIKTAFSLLLDSERKFSAHLEFLRQYPKIFTDCCKYEHCFLCKIEGHHEGRTCEEVQREESGAECQYCPGCNVPTLRSEGCSEIMCVCGEVWEWEGGSDDTSYSSHYDNFDGDDCDDDDDASGDWGECDY